MKKILITVVLVMAALAAMPQQFGQMGRLYQNPYQVNPAMAGNDEATSIYLNGSNQWYKITGAPTIVSFSGSTPLNDRAYVGINVFTDQSGLVRKTQGMGTFAYHLPLSDEQKLKFGVSLSWTGDYLDMGKAVGELDDDLLVNFNERQNYVDGNFGMAYYLDRFEVQFSWLSINNKRYHRISTIDRSLYYGSLSYKMKFDDDLFGLTPKVSYRHLESGFNYWDFAIACDIENIDFYAVYHSTKAFTGGFGVRMNEGARLGFYFTNSPKELRGFSGGVFDIVLGYVFEKRR
ncbi:PorP/SprF family type IX secretion system membrane protein [Pseudopedobacter beijingensis]|uniref:PorP/SprF family type IX secretion system membrane protein n=1 Tax=Pseudopedobacter beijingensis TaxID=1207056 RepID=A0ABW4I8B5_9SPHI